MTGGERTLDRGEAESSMSGTNGTTLVKIEFRSAQSRHTLAKYIEKKQRNNIARPGPEGPTEFGFIPRSKIPAKALGFPKKKAPRDSGAVKEKAVADLMGGQKKKSTVDPSAMYKMPAQAKSSEAAGSANGASASSGGFSYANNSDEEAEQLERVKRASAAEARRNKEASTSRAAKEKDVEVAPLPKVVVSPAEKRSKASTSAVPSARPSTSSLNTSTRPMFQRNVSNITRVFTPFDVSKAVVMKSGEFKVKICLDHREKYCKSFAKDPDVLVNELACGDVIWVAERIRPSGVRENDVIVLDAIVERKTLADLVGSVKDHRYDDQKVSLLPPRLETKLTYCLASHEKVGHDSTLLFDRKW